MATQTAPAVHSILSADFGSVNTRVVLLDLVSGQFRLVSRAQTLSTSAPPLVDVGVGLRRALEEITNLTGRNLLHGEDVIIGEQQDGSGIDLFLATASGGRPMKAVLVGLMPDVSVATGRRTLASTYVELTDTLSLADVRSTEDQVNAIVRNQPDLIFVVGGTNYGATESVLSLLKTVRLAVLLTQGHKPVVLYAGNEALRPMVKDMLGNDVELYMTSNVRPTLLEEKMSPAQLELAMVYGSYKSINAGGFTEVQSKSMLGVLPTAQSYANIVRFLGELPGAGIGVMCVDVGSSTVTICASIRKQPSITIRPDLGVGHSAVSGVKAVGARNVLRWLTFDATESEVMDYAYNKSLRPSTVPQSAQDLEFEYAIARELIRNAVAGARASWRGIPRGDLLPAMRPIIGAGSVLAQVVDPGIGALLMLDALQPVGVSELQLDPYGVIAALGGAAYVEPLAVVQVLETGGLLNLGTAISPLGRTREKTAMSVNVRMAGGRTVQRNIPAGTLQVIDLPSGQKAQVTIKLGVGLTLNGKRDITLTVEGGAAGLIFDARGRPFSPPREIERRAQVLPRWYAAVRSDNKG
ncbi:MAG: glutamate mutase L [Chloroflexota bacterium]